MKAFSMRSLSMLNAAAGCMRQDAALAQMGPRTRGYGMAISHGPYRLAISWWLRRDARDRLEPCPALAVLQAHVQNELRNTMS
jgi:hypothetical protein